MNSQFMTQRELQNEILAMLPTFRSELRKLEENLLTCGKLDYAFLSEAVVRNGMHIFGAVPEGHVIAGNPKYVPLDYIPCNHWTYIIRADRRKRPLDQDDVIRVEGRETCPLCGKPLRIHLDQPLSSQDLVLVGCPVLKEGVVIVDVLPIFSMTLVGEALSGCLGIPYQRSKHAMTRVDSLV